MSNKPPTKTDFARWLNVFGEDAPKLGMLWKTYTVMARKGGRLKFDSFGFWLQSNHSSVFNEQYTKWFVKHPELVDAIYNASS